MLHRDLESPKSGAGSRLRKFALALRASAIFLSRADQLVFLCGANQDGGLPSARRTAVKRLLEHLGYKVVYAEGVFKELAREHRKNVLDLEHEITAIADKIIIILESESSFCELGAFTHKELRAKLVVINDSHFRDSESFINSGPLKALAEARSPVLWYPMRRDGRTSVDGIGAIFSDLQNALFPRSPSGSVRLKEDLSLLSATKSSLYFIHDLILFTGPVTHDELILMLKLMFGPDRSYDRVKRLVGILTSAQMVEAVEAVDTGRFYKTNSTQPYLRYSANISALTAAFRVHRLKNSPTRFTYA